MREPLETLVLEHGKDESVAELYGVILFTDEHPNIKKVLRDEDYWLSFNEITGNRFCVFSIKPAPGKYECPHYSKGTVGFMVEIWKEPKENLLLIDLFGIKNTEKLPALILFTKIDDEYWTINLPLNDDSVSSSKNSISERMKFVTSVLEEINEDNLKNPEGLFAAMSLSVDEQIKWKRVGKLFNLYKLIVGLKP